MMGRVSYLVGSSTSDAGDLRKELIRGGMGSALLKGFNMMLGLGLAIVLARVLGPEGYGTYAFALSVVTLLAIPAQIGLPNLLVRDVARYQLRKQWGLLRGILRWANGVSLMLTFVIILCSGSIAWFVFVGDQGMTVQVETFYWALVLLPLLALGSLRGATLRGLRHVIEGQLPELVLRPAILLLLILTAATVGQPTASNTMALHVIAALVAFIVGASLLMYRLPNEIRATSADYERPAWIRSLLPFALLAGVGVINGQTDIVMLGMLDSRENVGIYRVTVQGATLVAFGLAAVNMVIAPHLARLHAAGENARLQRLVTMTARGIFSLALPPALLFILFGEQVLELLFGEPYQNGHIALAILCIGQLVNAAVGSVGYLLNMTGHERATVQGVGMAALVNVALNIVLIPTYGILGAATATTISLVVWNILLWHFVHRFLCLESTFMRPGSLRSCEKT